MVFEVPSYQYLQQLIYYHTLCMMLPQGGQRDGIPVTLEELAELLHCSVRNVRFIIKKMEQAGWIAWTSGQTLQHCAVSLGRRAVD
ncbi:hypothetical protein J27TS7_02030 [Paenibacillus dendritiformis]|uniref:SgrR family transcriptional regulator n=1 Tax=Paenibacillus dendritiformis TaxID=130049 RepID=UPI00143DE464|nr:SgrR family transcriptional regulator [Paenibacillus dendritiformis]NKI21252.1 hypothetical protein [Paenibacillus dendritiformis]NRF97856.1 SgrR family transcriptional regulator [Paenibacillus dendritiformis]GIO70689.1 hypothetical protein J27TS7_02030 [Paenibacillus dendritiformis]